MAEYYVYSGATGAADGSSWADAFTSLGTALSGKSGGDVFYVADDHAETNADAIFSPGTASALCVIMCVNRSGSVPPVSADLRTTATVTAASLSNIQFSGFAYCYGISFIKGNNAQNIQWISSSPWYWKLENCKLQLGTNASSRILIGANSSLIDDNLLELVNVTMAFGNASQTISVRAPLVWKATADAISGTEPTTLFAEPTFGNCGTAIVDGVDLSYLGSGKSLVNVSRPTFAKFFFANCKTGLSSFTTGTVAGQGGIFVTAINCDSSDTNYRFFQQAYQGTVESETVIVRSGGATDGTTAISRKIQSTANANFYSPLSFDIMFWNETTGSQLSLAAEVVSDNVTFTDKELWMEVEALTTSGFPLSSFTNDAAATILTTGVNQATSTATWTTTGLTTPVKQKLEINVTPQEKGWVRCRINLAKPSSTVYVCPLITGIGYTSGRQWQTSDAYLIEGGGTSGGVRIPNIRGGADQ